MSIFIYFATIFWSLFPNLIHVFQGGEDLINKVNEANLLVNSDLILDDNDDNVPDGFLLGYATKNSYLDGVITFTAIQQFGQMFTLYSDDYLGQELYLYANFKADSNEVRITYGQGLTAPHSGNNEYQLISMINNISVPLRYFQVSDYRASGFTPISVDYMGAYNVSVMKLNGVKNDDGILFTDLTDLQIKTQLDKWINDFGDLSFTISKDDTYDEWFIHGFVEKTAERDFLDYLGYFFWLSAPPIVLFLTLDLIRRII